MAHFDAALEVLQAVQASPLPAELIAITPGDPADSSEKNIRAPTEVAELAAVLRAHLPETGAEFLPDSPRMARIIPKRGSSATLQDKQEMVLTGEILGVLDRRRIALLQGADGLLELSIPPAAGIREILLETQKNQSSIELRMSPSYKMVDGIHKIRGGSLLEIIRIIENPTQGGLLD